MNDSNPFAAPAVNSAAEDSQPVATYSLRQIDGPLKVFRVMFYIGLPLLVLVNILSLLFTPAEMRDPQLMQEFLEKHKSDPLAMARLMMPIIAIGGVSMIALAVLAVGVVFAMILHYRCWALLGQDRPRTTPGKAVGFLFIPLFNLYWMFISYGALCADQFRAVTARGLNPQPAPSAMLMLMYVMIFLQVGLAVLGMVLSAQSNGAITTAHDIANIVGVVTCVIAVLAMMAVHARAAESAKTLIAHRESLSPEHQ